MKKMKAKKLDREITLIPDPGKSPVLQAYSYNPASKKIEVVHYINLEEGQDVILEKIEKSFSVGKKVIGSGMMPLAGK